MVVNYETYNVDKKEFFEKHDFDFIEETSPMDRYGRYFKVYTFKDGAQWFESVGPVFEKTEVDIKFVKVPVEVKLFQIEYWTSEWGSKFYYEKF